MPGLRSVAPTGGIRQSYRVLIRSLDERINECECRDFHLNQLGTCKHIEAVRHTLRKPKEQKRRGLGGARPQVPVVHVAWGLVDSPRVHLHGTTVDPELGRVLDHYFDDQRLLRGTLPGALDAFERAIQDRFEVEIGADARALAAQITAERARAERTRRVAQALRVGGGRVPGLRAMLLPYQVEGVAFLAGAERALLADDMGLGKTMQALAACLWLREHDGVERVLVVCPASLKAQWAREISRFSDARPLPVFGNSRQRRVLYARQADFTIVNYEQVLRDWEAISRKVAPDVIILDEAQRIRNWRTKTATAVKMLTSRFAFVLTGTPLENRLEDLYSLMQTVDQRRLGPLWRFQADFIVNDERGRPIAARNLSQLRRRLRPVMLRRDRSRVKDQLPPRVDHRLDVGLTARQKTIHDGALSQVREYMETLKRRPLTPSEEHRLMAALQRARMACNAAGLIDGKTEGSPKLTELERLLTEICVEAGDKVVVFSEWERMTRMAEQTATSLGLGVVRLHGGVPQARRGDLIARFESDPSAQVFISADAAPDAARLAEAAPETHAVPSDQVAALIAALQRHVGAGLRRLLMTARGLVAIADPLPADAAEVAARLSADIPCLIVDPATWAGLRRMGLVEGATPAPGTDAEGRPTEQPDPPHPLLGHVAGRLQAAEVLAGAGCMNEAALMAADALRSVAAILAGEASAPARDTLPAWLYGEAVPAGHLSADDAAMVLKADAVARTGGLTPDLAHQVIADARGLAQRLQPPA